MNSKTDFILTDDQKTSMERFLKRLSSKYNDLKKTTAELFDSYIFDGENLVSNGETLESYVLAYRKQKYFLSLYSAMLLYSETNEANRADDLEKLTLLKSSFHTQPFSDELEETYAEFERVISNAV